MNEQYDNPTFINDNGKAEFQVVKENLAEEKNSDKKPVVRAQWGKDIEFLLSCVAMSVGLGNIWRFPFTALENGGGAFLIPYLIVLFLVGKPFYYLEMIIGQFSSCGPVKVYNFCPAMRGIGIGQVISVSMISTYYVAIMGLCLKYVVDSFQAVLPWSVCDKQWGPTCIGSNTDSLDSESLNNSTIIKSSSAELYFLKKVMNEPDNINGGIGLPSWELVICLLVAWITVYIILVRGIKSSGKFSYFLAIFPYFVLIILLIRAVTLPGASAGMIYFIKPQWEELLNPKVWYAAVTQVFFSLTVCLGCVVNYSSYNRFGQNIYRDATIVTLLDTFTSLLAGLTTFGILGHLAHEMGIEDIATVVKGGTGLAFISYPDAIARFDIVPQAFSVLFFLLLFVLGIGSNIAMMSCSMTTITDNFPQIKTWQSALGIAIVSFLIGLIYVTPGGLFMLNLVDYHGAAMNCLILGIMELLVLGWIYGVSNICKDTKFMIDKNPGYYWRLCWAIITPIIMIAILIYFFVNYKPLDYNGIEYPDWAYGIGWLISGFAIAQVPLWAIIAIMKQPGITFKDKFFGAFKPTKKWGPSDPVLKEQYDKILRADNEVNLYKSPGIFNKIKRNICD